MPGFNDVPFNFVPLNKKVYIPEWGDEISQDIPFSDGEDGIISFDIENLTPLFIKNDMEKYSFSAHVMEKNGKKLYFLPATSLKGMLRSVLEILSFSRLKQYNNDWFGYRTFDRGNDYVNQLRDDIYCGWLQKDGSTDTYTISECPDGIRSTTKSQILEIYLEFIKRTDPVRAAQIDDEINELFQEDKERVYTISKIIVNYLYENDLERVLRELGRRRRGLPEGFSLTTEEKRTIRTIKQRMNLPGKLLRGDLIEKSKLFKNDDDLYPSVLDGQKRLVYTGFIRSGFMKNKCAEYLFDNPECCQNKLKVDKNVMESFFTVYKMSPKEYNAFITQQLDKDKLAVFYKKNNNNQVESLGITRMYRLPYLHNVKDGIHQDPESGLDLSECIFGFTDKDAALKGRVLVGNAFGESVEDSNIDIKKGVLGEPKASFFPYYLRNGRNYNQNQIEIAGRKRYRVHSDNNISETLPGGNENENTKSTLRLLPAGCHFHCIIRLHNMRPVETGALLSALTFHNNQKMCHHTIGMGKAFGYGKLKISNLKLNVNGDNSATKAVGDYLKVFEESMNSFYQKQCTDEESNADERWIDSLQLQRLFQIASNHNATLEYMDLDGYKEGRINPQQLIEPELENRNLTLMTPVDLFQRNPLFLQIQEDLKLMESNVVVNDITTLYSQCDAIETRCGYLDTHHMPELENLVEELINKVNVIRRTIDIRRNQQEFEYKKPASFKAVINKINKLSERRNGLNEPDKSVIVKSIEEQNGFTDNRKLTRKKNWEQDKASWVSLMNYIGEENTFRIYKHIIS